MRETKRGETIPSQSPKKPGTKPGSMHIDKRAGRLLADPVSDGPDDELLTTEEVANWVGVSSQFLERLRGLNTGPRFVRISPRIVKYRREAVRAWLRSRERKSTRKA
jgi:predicted DNA-binding transcriptional regulator AlpA